MDRTLITQDRLDEIKRLSLLSPKSVGVYLAEVGVYKGGSLKLIAESNPEYYTIGFDTFTGLPSLQWNDKEIHRPGDFNDTSMEAVRKFVGEDVTLVQGIFPGSATLLEDDKFCFVHVDTDFYEGVKACIEWFVPRLVEGGIMVFDDYQWPNCPGVEQALKESGLEFHPTNAKYQAFLIKK